MKSNGSNVVRLLVTSAVALLFFCVGYFAPHRPAALAQTPNPESSIVGDDVPGGGGAKGAAIVTGISKPTHETLAIAQKSGWPCANGDRCAVHFAFRLARASGAPPAPYTCQNVSNCLTFAGSGFEFEHVHSNGHVEKHSNVQIAGMFQLVVVK